MTITTRVARLALAAAVAAGAFAATAVADPVTVEDQTAERIWLEDEFNVPQYGGSDPSETYIDVFVEPDGSASIEVDAICKKPYLGLPMLSSTGRCDLATVEGTFKYRFNDGQMDGLLIGHPTEECPGGIAVRYTAVDAEDPMDTAATDTDDGASVGTRSDDLWTLTWIDEPKVCERSTVRSFRSGKLHRITEQTTNANATL